VTDNPEFDYQLVDLTQAVNTLQEERILSVLNIPRVALRPEFVLSPQTTQLDGKGFLVFFRNGQSGWALDGASDRAQVQPDANGFLGNFSVWFYAAYLDPAATYSVVLKVWSSSNGPAPSYEIYGPGGFHKIVVANGNQYFVVKFSGSDSFWGISMSGHDLANWHFYSATVYKLPN
jgi:hypothetical protein